MPNAYVVSNDAGIPPMAGGSPELDAMVAQYVETAIWSSLDDEGRSLDRNYGPEDIAPAALASMRADCAAFLADNAADLADVDPEQAGHDFWLTRNRHGAGFWDGDYPPATGARLTAAADVYGESDLYVADVGAGRQLDVYPR